MWFVLIVRRCIEKSFPNINLCQGKWEHQDHRGRCKAPLGLEGPLQTGYTCSILVKQSGVQKAPTQTLLPQGPLGASTNAYSQEVPRCPNLLCVAAPSITFHLNFYYRPHLSWVIFLYPTIMIRFLFQKTNSHWTQVKQHQTPVKALVIRRAERKDLSAL